MSESHFKQGFYAAFFAGKSSEGFGILVFHKGKITGADPLGVLFDGAYTVDDKGSITFHVDVQVQGYGTLVQGITVGVEGLTYSVEAHLPANFAEGPYSTIKTQFGPVNVRFVFLRGLE